jgi:hypothetical protein
MKPATRFKFYLSATLALLLGLFAFNAVSGQFRQPRPPVGRPPVIRPPVVRPPVINPPVVQPPIIINQPGPTQIIVWKCETCGKEVSRGGAPPDTCPFCGVKFNAVHLNGQGGAPPITLPVTSGDNTPANTSTSTSSSAPRWTFIGLIVGIILVGVFVILGGTFLMIYTMKGNGSSSRRRRRPRINDDYDRD